jgi:hypothetical protein
MSPTLNQKLVMIMLSTEGMLKAEISRKLGLLCQIICRLVSVKEEFSKGNYKCYFSERMNNKE